MKDLNEIRFFLVVSFLSTVLFGLYFCYQANIFDVKETIVRVKRKNIILKINIEEVKEPMTNIKRKRIHSDLVKPTQTNKLRQGYISIPSLNILLPIFGDAYDPIALSSGANIFPSGTDGKETLQEQLKKYSVVVLAAHNYNDGVTAFSPLQEHINHNEPYLIDGEIFNNNWLKGRKIYIATSQNVYEYELGTQYLIDGNDLSITNTDTEWPLKLITCLYPSDKYRIVTPAKFINIYTWETVPTDILYLFDLSKQTTNIYNTQFPGEEEGMKNGKEKQ